MEHKPQAPRMAGWLLLLTLALGYVCAFVFFQTRWGVPRDLMPAYALFWGLYLAAYYLCLWQRAKSKWEGWYLLSAVALLFLHSALYREETLNLLNFLIIPLALMLHAVMCAFDFPPGAAWLWVRSYLLCWCLYPFSAIGKWFAAWAALLRRGAAEDGEEGAFAARRNTLLGLLFGLPVLIAVCALLLKADQAMGMALAGLLEKLPQVSFNKIILLFIIAVLFYSFIYNLAWGEEGGTLPALSKEGIKATVPAQSLMAAVSMLLAAYLVFAIFQFTYLTGWKGLPAGLTYSEYAVSGFGQLLWVAAINLCVFSVGLCRTRPHKGLKPLLGLLLLATAVVLLSAFVRLGLYIGAYALTWRRLLSLWLMLYLAAAVILCALRLYGIGALGKPGLLRLCALLLVGWYVALNLVNVEGMIAQSVFRLADRRGGVLTEADANYLRYDLSIDAKAAIEASPYAGEVYYDVEPAHLP